MTDHGKKGAPPERGSTDHELDIRGVMTFMIGLGIVMAFVLALMYGLSAGFRSRLVGQDPPPPVMEEARVAKPRPEPHLQDKPLPNEDMAAFRAEEDRVLNGYAVTDEANGYARIPVDRAIDILAEKGLPQTAAPAPATASSPAPSPTAPREVKR